MKILLDAKDLIAIVEHSKPLPLPDLSAWLRERNAKLVFSFENIRALAGPLGQSSSHLPRILGYLETLEDVPHCFILADIETAELRSAASAFNAKREYEPIDPYVSRFDQVFPGVEKPGKERYPISEVVLDVWNRAPQIFGPRQQLHAIQALAMDQDRERLKRKSAIRLELPIEAVVEPLVNKLSIPLERAQAIAEWIARDPSRCPALWMLRSIGLVMSRNLGYKARYGDVFDMADTAFIPYIDVATLDRTMLHYYTSAVQSLGARGAVEYASKRVFRNLSELMKLLDERLAV